MTKSEEYTKSYICKLLLSQVIQFLAEKESPGSATS